MSAPLSDAASTPQPTWIEQAVAGAILIVLSGALIGPVFAPTQEETPVLRLIWLPVYAAVLGLLAWRADRVIRAWPAFIAVGLLILLAFASKWWSIDAEVTQRRTLALALTSLFAVYLGGVFTGTSLPRLLAITSLVMAIGSLVMIFAFPVIGVHQDVNAGLWRGLWYEKNQMGAVMVIGATASAACLASPDPRKLIPLAALALTTLLVLATQSKTSLLCLMVGLGLVGGFWAMRQGGAAFAVAAVWGAVVLAAAGVWLWESHSVAILEALGKDPSLTGRTDIWDSLLRQVAERPMTGFGYGAFWGRVGESPPADWVRLETNWDVPSAHNGWIDLLVQLGWPGVLLTGAVCAVAVIATLIRSNGAGPREGWWALGFLGAFIVLSLSESILVGHQSLPWVLFIAVLTRSLLPAEARAPARLAPAAGRAYQSLPRIAAHSRHGPARRPVLVPRRP